VPVTVLPGASAVETALVASGLVSDRWQFVGYLPRAERALDELWAELAGWPGAVVAFESPQRLPGTLRSLAAALPGRELAVCRELTKRFEEVVRGTPAELAERFAEPPRGEITLVLGPAEPVEDEAGEREALDAVAELVASGVSRRDAAALVARLTGVARNRLYGGSL
jgi:16S rRNA (cytidine1402-2'-O)-methyltransferase